MRFMNRSVILYRGSLKSCNYHCSYCPFSKHPASKREESLDRERWFRFVESIEAGFRGGDMPKRYGGVMVTPYGEALNHLWYWEGIARMSALDKMDRVGVQTNLSFPEEKSLAVFHDMGGKLEKLCLWATFHPEMVPAGTFAEKCRKLGKMGISLCAGAVGVPGTAGLLMELKKQLPNEVYLWVNKMDGMKREYTPEEKRQFLEIDPYFWRELEIVPADESQCRERAFVEADGSMRVCNISRKMGESWYGQGKATGEVCSGQEGRQHRTGSTEQEKRQADVTVSKCGRRTCSCYLAYGGRQDWMNHLMFGDYPVFRIPRRPKASFLDIDGTLVIKGKSKNEGRAKKGRGKAGGLREQGITDSIKMGLETLVREGSLLFFATTLPYEEALRRCREIRHWFYGGVFAGGAHVCLEKDGKRREYFYELDRTVLCRLDNIRGRFGFRVLAYEAGGRLYKLTLLRPAAKPWGREEAEELADFLEPECRKNIRWIREENCLQIVASGASKAAGVRMMCQWLGIGLWETAAAGDSPEDAEMMEQLKKPSGSLPDDSFCPDRFMEANLLS